MPTHLILTVGTGTAGPHSNLVLGLRRTLELGAPDRYWLIPSASPDSIATADLVREDIAGFQPWAGAEQPYRCIAQHDSLADCRAAVREVIAAARAGLTRGARLVVNPTSGTKQMSAGATLAALDEEVGEIVFTVGERSDGVVMTGTEKLEAFDASAYFAERDLATASDLFAAGAFAAAARLLQSHRHRWPRFAGAHDVATCAHEWQRLRFAQARQIASRSESSVLAPLRVPLTRLAEAPESSPALVVELLASARRCLDWQEPEEALARAYRAAELMAKRRLAAHHHLEEPYQLEDFQQALPSRGQQFQAVARDGVLLLGLRQAFDVLDALGDPLGRAFFTGDLLKPLALRNVTLFGHGTATAGHGEVAPLIDGLSSLVRIYLQAAPAEPFPNRLC